MPSRGLLPPTTTLSGMPVMSAVPTAGPASSSSLTPRLAEKIWKGKFVKLSELLPSRLGALEVTYTEGLDVKQRQTSKPNRITSIQQWVVCLNSVISVVALKHPERVQDLLGYSSMITKASLDYEGTPWLAYDAHFRRLAAAN